MTLIFFITSGSYGGERLRSSSSTPSFSSGEHVYITLISVCLIDQGQFLNIIMDIMLSRLQIDNNLSVWTLMYVLTCLCTWTPLIYGYPCVYGRPCMYYHTFIREHHCIIESMYVLSYLYAWTQCIYRHPCINGLPCP